MTAANPFDALIPLDPELAHVLAEAHRQSGQVLPAALTEEMVDTLLKAYAQEIHFGEALAEGYRKLLTGGDPEAVTVFNHEMVQAAARSAALGRNLAAVLPAVLLARRPGLLDAFQRTLAILLSKGEYLVKAPLEGLTAVLTPEEDSGEAYLALLRVVFNRPLSYNRCQHLGHLLPRAVRQLPASHRSAQIRQMTRLVSVDLNLAEPFLEGLSQGLHLLSDKALHTFVDQGLAWIGEDPQAARRFLSLRSGQGREACRSLQTAVRLADCQGRLNRYLKARTGQACGVKPLSTIRTSCDSPSPDGLHSVTDGVYLYLPDAVDRFAQQTDNARLLMVMAKFEAGLIEFGTFAFDLQRARNLGCLWGLPTVVAPPPDTLESDLATFGRSFDNPRLALDLFTIFEHARIRVRLAEAYPGLVRTGLPFYQSAMQAQLDRQPRANLLDVCYAVLALDLAPGPVLRQRPALGTLVRHLSEALVAADPATMRVEQCAGLVAATYTRVQAALKQAAGAPAPLAPAYRMALQPNLITAAGRPVDRQAKRLFKRLQAEGVQVYRGDLRQLLLQTGGRPTVGEIRQLIRQHARRTNGKGFPPDVGALFGMTTGASNPLDRSADDGDPQDVDRITWQKEWNAPLGDYLYDHVRVRDRRLAGSDLAFFRNVLARRAGLVRRIRKSFELLRPEGLGILRQWVEGDDFDYRALLDVVLDRKAGRQPSERLYIKRIKQRRDVAVLLLVDLSRSTSNIVDGSSASVLDVAKEALVLFTQALEIVGDAYALAGFSGTGRLGVDFFRIKDFDEPLGRTVKGTISALRPQRSTRMGAAVRRAARELSLRENRVRLLMMIGDGFPNDTDYKGAYALQDTRQAIAEACSRGIITQAITVNLPTIPRLDDLYGPVRHTVITKVAELPDKLLRLYGALTRA
jgi:hypothetical protein